MPEDPKLYVRIVCSICRGQNRSCFYCDEQGKQYVEASLRSIKKWLKERNENDRLEFRKVLEDE